MVSRRAFITSSFAAIVSVSFLGMCPRSAAQAANLQKAVEGKYALTKPTDDKSDIVTAGAILILQKDRLLMYPVSTPTPPQNTFKDGHLSAGVFAAHDAAQKFGKFIGHPPPQTVDTRYFVTGEKFWVTKIDYPADGVVFWLFTDAINDVRYYSTLKFVYPKGVNLTSDQVLELVGQVLKVQEDDSTKADNSGNQQQGADANQQQQQQAAPAEQAPPAQPATVEIGQSVDDVVGILGQPEKIINLGAKQIYVYKDLKVTFVKGKVTDAQ
ncbi:MAG TPA: hypothetical protein VEG64_01250 [Candidatus Sulfotelmatobacter sp.]|nr:hypothetical protein [Candidatus Sulfotelmatobacter sp.]